MNDVITKLISDISINLIIKQMSLGNTLADTIVAVEGTDNTSDFKLYYDPEDVATDLGEDTNVYKKVAAAFAQDNFMGPIGVLTYPKGDQQIIADSPTTTYSTKSTPTADGASVELESNSSTTVTVPGIIAGLADHLWDGWRYLILDKDDDVETIKDVMHYLYTNQHGILVASVTTIDNLKTLHDEAIGMVQKNHMGNTVVIVNKNEEEYHDIDAAVFASQHIPLDWMHVRNLNGFTPNKWNATEYQQILNLNGLTTVNKAGDVVLSNSKALDGSFIDNTFGIQYTRDAIQSGLQRFINSHDLLAYDDAGIKLVIANAESIMNNVAKAGILANGLDGKPIFTVTGVDRAHTPNVNVVKRRYTGLSITCQLVGSMETIPLQLAVTL